MPRPSVPDRQRLCLTRPGSCLRRYATDRRLRRNAGAAGGRPSPSHCATVQVGSSTRSKAKQAHTLVACRLSQIELRDISAVAVAGIRDGEGRRDGLAAADFEIPVVEARVVEAVAEGVERSRPGLSEPAIADLGAHVVPDGGGSALIESIRGRPRRAQALEIRAGSLPKVRREGNR